MRYYFVIILLLCEISGFTQELKEFRGIERSGIFNESNLLKEWPAEGPELLLKINGIGKGYSSPVFYNNIIYVTGISQDSMDALSAFNQSGKLLWQTIYGRAWTRTYSDTRCTPTIEKGKVFLIGGVGNVSCIDAELGNIIWQVDAHKKYNGEIHRFGVAESVLLTNKAVIYTTGGEENSVVAFDKTDGKFLWKSKSLGGARAYASPTLINHNGIEIILAQTTNHLLGIKANDGKILWSYNLIRFHTHRQGKGGNTNPPIFNNSEIFVTSGYNHPGIMLSLSDDGNNVTLKWKNDTLDTHHGGVVLVDGNLYGSNWENNSRGKWASLNWETGKVNWEANWFNKGSVISADKMLYLFEEKSGNLALVEPNPEDLKIISTFKIDKGNGPYWAHPAIYCGKLFVRHGDVLLVYNIQSL